jgi:hypothetical protein
MPGFGRHSRLSKTTRSGAAPASDDGMVRQLCSTRQARSSIALRAISLQAKTRV